MSPKTDAMELKIWQLYCLHTCASSWLPSKKKQNLTAWNELWRFRLHTWSHSLWKITHSNTETTLCHNEWASRTRPRTKNLQLFETRSCTCLTFSLAIISTGPPWGREKQVETDLGGTPVEIQKSIRIKHALREVKCYHNTPDRQIYNKVSANKGKVTNKRLCQSITFLL